MPAGQGAGRTARAAHLKDTYMWAVDTYTNLGRCVHCHVYTDHQSQEFYKSAQIARVRQCRVRKCRAPPDGCRAAPPLACARPPEWRQRSSRLRAAAELSTAAAAVGTSTTSCTTTTAMESMSAQEHRATTASPQARSELGVGIGME